MSNTPSKTFSILMCAYNEERNISAIIEDIFNQQLPGGWELSEFLIISDNSEDNTDKIVKSKQSIYTKLKLIRHNKRRGKNTNLNEAHQSLETDYCLIIDSDIRLTEGLFIKLLSEADKGYDLIAGNQQPINQKYQTLSSRAEIFSCALMSRVAIDNQFYGFDGKLLLVSRELSRQVILPPNVNEDRYLYLFAKYKGFRPIRIPDAIFYFKTTQNISDYIEQRRRNRGLSEMTRKLIGTSFFDKETRIKKGMLLAYVLKEAGKDLFGAAIWIIYTSLSIIWFAVTYHVLGLKSDQRWKMLKSTKNLG
jgi:glycosyltransferase involved in cell wall biosynthesis